MKNSTQYSSFNINQSENQTYIIWQYLIAPSLAALLIGIFAMNILSMAGDPFTVRNRSPLSIWAVEVVGVPNLIHSDSFNCQEEGTMSVCIIDINGKSLRVMTPTFAPGAPCEASFASEPIQCLRIRVSDGINTSGVQVDSPELLNAINTGWSIPKSWKTLLLRIPEHVMLRYSTVISTFVAIFSVYILPMLSNKDIQPNYPSRTFTIIVSSLGILFISGMLVWLFLNGFIQPGFMFFTEAQFKPDNVEFVIDLMFGMFFAALSLSTIFYLITRYKRYKPLFDSSLASISQIFELKAIVSLCILIALYHQLAFKLLHSGFID